MNPYGKPPGFFDLLLELPLFFLLFGGLITAIVFGGFLYIIVKGLTLWSANNRAEMMEKKAKVIHKRSQVWGGSGDSSVNTDYFITFEMEDGRRIELQVKPQDFGLYLVGDEGIVRYQGTRFKGFTRTAAAE